MIKSQNRYDLFESISLVIIGWIVFFIGNTMQIPMYVKVTLLSVARVLP
jgi:hypothetical protein